MPANESTNLKKTLGILSVKFSCWYEITRDGIAVLYLSFYIFAISDNFGMFCDEADKCDVEYSCA